MGARGRPFASTAKVEIDGDANVIDIVEALSEMLEQHGFALAFDETEEHDGFEIVKLVKTEES